MRKVTVTIVTSSFHFKIEFQPTLSSTSKGSTYWLRRRCMPPTGIRSQTFYIGLVFALNGPEQKLLAVMIHNHCCFLLLISTYFFSAIAKLYLYCNKSHLLLFFFILESTVRWWSECNRTGIRSQSISSPNVIGHGRFSHHLSENQLSLFHQI